jgi:hypothetical protein
MNFKDSLNNLKLDLTKLVIIPSGGSSGLDSNFEIDPKDFLRYAKEDMHTGNDRGIVNGLSNAKRAIDCQIDEVLQYLGVDFKNIPKSLDAFLKFIDFNDDISYKLKIIQGLNIAPGLIITKYRNLRNKLEHFYKIPTIDEVKEAIDIADLFIRSIEGHYKGQMDEFYITDKKNFIKDFEFKIGYTFMYNDKSKCFNIFEQHSGKRLNEINIKISDIEFYGFIRLMNSINDEFELTESFKIISKLIDHQMPANHINIVQY